MVEAVAIVALSILGFLVLCEFLIRIMVDMPSKTDFYSSIKKDEIHLLQQKFGLKVNCSHDWIHLGWIANPDEDNYIILKRSDNDVWTKIGSSRFGSFLISGLKPSTSYIFRVRNESGSFDYQADTETKQPVSGEKYKPVINSQWNKLFRPHIYGSYINDHTIYQSKDGKWHIIGITASGDGDFSKEKYFAHGVCESFPFSEGTAMEDSVPAADNGHLAWAPCVYSNNGQYYMWYSPHTAYCEISGDGNSWVRKDEHNFLPFHKQFRDPMVIKAADDQWLMYATARPGYYSAVDIYQSFDGIHWQYIRPALRTGFGCERASMLSSAESPFMMKYKDSYYLSMTFTNDSFFLGPIMTGMKKIKDRESYNDTLVFHSLNPYNFGKYRGRKKPSSLVNTLRAHAPEYIEHNGNWYITTCGWPWAATITSGEAAWAKLSWERLK